MRLYRVTRGVERRGALSEAVHQREKGESTGGHKLVIQIQYNTYISAILWEKKKLNRDEKNKQQYLWALNTGRSISEENMSVYNVNA